MTIDQLNRAITRVLVMLLSACITILVITHGIVRPAERRAIENARVSVEEDGIYIEYRNITYVHEN